MNGKYSSLKALKPFIAGFLIFISSSSVYAQNSFEEELFSAKTALKYRIEIGLSEQQIANIQEIYSAHITEFEIMRFDLDAELQALDKIMAKDRVDEKEATDKLQTVLRLEENLKRVRLLMLVRIKNTLNSSQQERLKELRTENDIDGFLMTAPINNNQKFTLQLRGIQGSGPQPLYVLKTSSGDKEVSRSFISSLDTSDIESIKIIKDEAAIRMFGNKGKNGVVYLEIKESN